jgi:hypothetical protein
MSTTYEKLLSMIDFSSEILRDEVTGTLIAYKPKSFGDGFSVTVIESFKSKKLKNYTAKKVEQIKSLFSRLVSNLQERAKVALGYREERKNSAKKFLDALKPGVILSDSWGYEQTNVEFYIVIEVTGSKVKLQELGHRQEGEATSWASCHVMPDVENKHGPVIEKTVRGAGISIESSITLTLWNGKPCYKSWYY